MNKEHAFPSGAMTPDGLHISEAINEGLSIRDYFAAKAMAALIMKLETRSLVASSAYAIADAMLEARKN